MKAFNAFQITALFAIGPIVIDYVSDASFRGAGPLFYAACVTYGIGFVAMAKAVYDNL